MTMWPVSLTKQSELAQRMQRIGMQEADLAEHFVRSSGAGGQNVNKVATCVVLRHPKTGTEVKCQQTRSQAMNRFLARRLLCEKLEQQILGKKSAARQAQEKIRRQKRRRSRRAKEKMLENKRHRAGIKQSRRPPGVE